MSVLLFQMQLFFVYNNTKLYCFFLCFQAMRPICRINRFLLMENATPTPLIPPSHIFFPFPLDSPPSHQVQLTKYHAPGVR